MAELAAKLDYEDITVGSELRRGGQGRVFDVSAPLLDGGREAVLKLYLPSALGNLNVTALEKLVYFARDLPPTDKNWLYDNCAWPVSIVEKSGNACGFLMRKAPSDYFFDFQSQAKGTQRKLSDVAFLLNSEDYVRRAGLWVTDYDRLVILETVATSLSRLHGLGITIGDLSPKNVLFRLQPTPGSFFIDCDSFRLKGETALEQLETGDWKAPAREKKATVATDSYKFGLLAIRLFAHDQTTRDPSAISAKSPVLGRLARLSLDAPPDSRPTPGQWVDEIRQVIGSTPPASGPTASTGSGGAVPPYVANGPARVYPPRPASYPVRPFPVRTAALILGGTLALILVFVFAILPALTGSPAAVSATNPAAQEEAATINTLLDQSSSSQVELEFAMSHIFACSDVAGNASQVNTVVGQRSSELSEASGLPVAALPNGASLRSYLVEVLRISLHADEDYLTWANGVTAHGCGAQNLQDPTYANGYKLTNDVVAAKLNFLPLWNYVARKYGFQPRTQSDI